MEVSVPLEDVMVNEVEATRALIYKWPRVPLVLAWDKKIRVFAVTLVLDTSIVPPTNVACPIRLLLPSRRLKAVHPRSPESWTLCVSTSICISLSILS